MSHEKIIAEWEKKVFKPLYWLEGEEDYFIDKVMDYAEHRILTESESGFNLTVFYGKDASWPDIINACRRYPMFSERQVVLLKEAQQMRDIEKLEPYVENPLKSTILVVSYKEKKVDGRTKFAKLIKERGVLLSTRFPTTVVDGLLDWVTWGTIFARSRESLYAAVSTAGAIATVSVTTGGVVLTVFALFFFLGGALRRWPNPSPGNSIATDTTTVIKIDKRFIAPLF